MIDTNACYMEALKIALLTEINSNEMLIIDGFVDFRSILFDLL
jgi:hypothetical protein